MRKRFGKKTMAAATFVVAALAFAAAGLAYYTTSGTGDGPAQLAHAQNLTVTPADPAPAASLVPGSSTSVEATVHNPNTYAVRVHSFVLNLGQASEGIVNDKPGCSSGGNTGSSTSSVTFNGPVTDVGSDFVFAPGDTALTLPGALTMHTSAEDACRGAAFTAYLQASNS
jgi:hypothetical protein